MRYPLLFLCSIQSLSVQVALPKTSQSTPLQQRKAEKGWPQCPVIQVQPELATPRLASGKGWLLLGRVCFVHREFISTLGKGEWPEKLSAYLLYAFFRENTLLQCGCTLNNSKPRSVHSKLPLSSHM